MADYDETTYGERIAEVYDVFYGVRQDLEPVPQPKVESIESAKRPRLRMVPAGRKRRAGG